MKKIEKLSKRSRFRDGIIMDLDCNIDYINLGLEDLSDVVFVSDKYLAYYKLYCI